MEVRDWGIVVVGGRHSHPHVLRSLTITTHSPPDDTSSDTERAALLSEALDFAAQREEAAGSRQEPKRRPRGPILAVLSLLLVISGVFNLRAMLGPVEIGTPEQRTRAVRATLYVTAYAIEAFRDEKGRLPESLEEIGEDEPEVVYTRQGDGYRLEMTVGESNAIYVSGEDLEALRGALLPQDGGAE